MAVIRYEKTVNGVVHKYYLNGSTITAETIVDNGNVTYIEYFYDTLGAHSFSLNGTMYFYIKNLQGDVMHIATADNTIVASYTYDAWGNIESLTGTLADTVGTINPIRYRGYYYDNETGLYYVSSRYYDPEIGRWINADNRISGVGGNILGYNMFAYCMNNPVNMSDPSGNWPKLIEKWIETVANWVNDNIIQPIVNLVNDNCIKHDVPLYDQGKMRLCWAYCQIMVEDYQNDTTSTQSEVDSRAKQLAIQENGSNNWNRGNWPTNLGEKIKVSQISDIKTLHSKLQQGPLYAYYDNLQLKGGAHLVVVTGVNCFTGKVYTNNPHGIFGEQSFDEFLSNYTGGDESVSLVYVYTIM